MVSFTVVLCVRVLFVMYGSMVLSGILANVERSEMYELLSKALFLFSFGMGMMFTSCVYAVGVESKCVSVCEIGFLLPGLCLPMYEEEVISELISESLRLCLFLVSIVFLSLILCLLYSDNNFHA